MMTMGNSQFKTMIMEQAKKEHLIRHCMIEILDSCNYKCEHCYVHNTYNSIMSYENYTRHIDELISLGCVWILLTGGEPLMHPRFLDMYRYAKEKGMSVTVFTNGFNFDDNVYKLFSEYKPELVEISLYGGKSDMYNEYVGIAGAFEKVDHVIDSLRKIGIKLKLKTVLTKKLEKQFEDMKKYGEEKDIEFRYDGFIVPKINGDVSLCENHRNSSEMILKFDCGRNGFLQGMKNRMETKNYTRSNKLYACDAGYNSVFIDARSIMSICSFARHISVDLIEDITIKEGRQMLIKQLEEKRNLQKGDYCYECKKKDLCRYCPGQFMLQNGDEFTPIDWNCQYADKLYTILTREN